MTVLMQDYSNITMKWLSQVVKMLEKPDQPIRYSLKGEVKTGMLFSRSVHMSRNGEIIPGDFIPE